MSALARTDTSVVGRWWWTVDRWSLAGIATLVLIGAVLTLAASPAVADRIGLDSFFFVKRHFALLPPALLVMFGTSMLSPLGVRRLGAIGFVVSLVLLAATLFGGDEIKGARRWLYLGAWSLQPSEFVKPTFAVVAAWMFAQAKVDPGFPGNWLSAGLLALVCGPMLLQPDFGMVVMVAAAWSAQFFIAGLPMVWVGLLTGLALGGGVAAYALLPHVARRIDLFLNPASGDTYQVDRAIEAFANGGLLGRGPGEGVIKTVIPDAHTDFIFAVAGEEFGLMVCLLIVALFAFVLIRGMARMLQENDYFILLATSGLLVQFGLQAVINMGVNLRLMPTKGLTLPFVSYGGSSLLALAIALGMVLALTRHRVGAGATS
ncbi:MAG: putative peptidoglycan glycosyltransferase FtsW [Alphaproteobacteria bacterium]|nr:putative peptidoglycan glycosyltransferase FtsW [Alphaproteobacteria bacterium]